MEVLSIAVMGIVNILCFIFGAKVGQSVAKGESVKLPDINPINAIREHTEKTQTEKAQRQERERIDTIMHNIDVYDGTSVGQKEVPKG